MTLHVGAGTFQPVKSVDNIADHIMHAEYVEVSQEVVDAIKETKGAGGRVIAVGTTSMRSLESAAKAATEKEELDCSFLSRYRHFYYAGLQI